MTAQRPFTSHAALASLACLTVMRASVDLIVAGGNDKLKRCEACAWIDGKMTTDFRVIKGLIPVLGVRAIVSEES